MYKLVLLRHGRSLADDENKIEGRYDSPLTEIGIRQADEISMFLRDAQYKFDSIISSPLARAYATAQIINHHYNVPLVVTDLLMERDNGVLAGLERSEADQKFPKTVKQTPLSYFPNNSGENLVLLHSRALVALDFILKREPGHYLVVSHGNFLNALIRTILGIPIPTSQAGSFFRFKDNGFIEFEYYENENRWIMERMK